jgi:hypothetical protein
MNTPIIPRPRADVTAHVTLLAVSSGARLRGDRAGDLSRPLDGLGSVSDFPGVCPACCRCRSQSAGSMPPAGSCRERLRACAITSSTNLGSDVPSANSRAQRARHTRARRPCASLREIRRTEGSDGHERVGADLESA